MMNLFSRRIYQFAVSKNKRNFYEILQISRTASPDQVKNSYYKLAKQYHPDAHNQSTSVAQMFKQINQAYNILKDQTKRKQYDEQNFTPQGQKKQYKFYDTQHTYGYNAKSYRKNPYQASNPFEQTFRDQNPFRQTGNSNPYNSDFSSFFSSKSQQSPSSSTPNPNQSWQEFVKQQHRKNVYENRKIGLNRIKRQQSIIAIVLGLVSVWIVGQLTFKIYQFNSFYRIRSHAEKLDSRQLLEYQEQARRMPRGNYN